MFAGSQCSKHVLVRRDKRILLAQVFAVDPQPRVLGSLQKQHDALAGPGVWNVDIALIPSRADVGKKPRQAFGLLGFVGRSLAVFIGAAGQLNLVLQIVLEPFICNTVVFRVQCESPLALQREPVIGGRCLHRSGQKNAENKKYNLTHRLHRALLLFM